MNHTIDRKAIVIRVSGPDAERYLNGQVSNDVTLADENHAIDACLLNAKGQLEAFVHIYREGKDYLVQAPLSLKDDLMARLDKYLISDDVTLTYLTDNHDKNQFPPLDEIERIEKVIPLWPHELFPGLLIHEAGIDLTAVSYTKGCYTGQEVVSRMQRAGKTNKHLIKLTLDQTSVPAGAQLLSEGQEAGWITSTAPLDTDQAIALAYRKRKFETIETFDVQCPDSEKIIATAVIR